MTEEHQHHEHHEHHEHHAQHEQAHQTHAYYEPKSSGSKMPQSAIILVIVALVVGLLIGFAISGMSKPAANPTNTTGNSSLVVKVSSDVASAKSIAYLNENFLAPRGLEAKLVEVSEKAGMYFLAFDITQNGTVVQPAEAYISLDGNTLVIGNTFDLNSKPATPTATATPKPVVKTEKPDVKVFVMGHCPYGVAAEYALIPAMKLLGGKATFDIRFIAEQAGNNTFDSLHGEKEVQEDMRQLCISANQPDKFLSYLECFVEKPGKAVRDGDNAAYSAATANDGWVKAADACMATAKVDVANVTACMANGQGVELLKKNIVLAGTLGIGSSPTILINEGNAQSHAMSSPEDFKNEICSAFTTAPAECAQALSNATAASGSGSGVACGA